MRLIRLTLSNFQGITDLTVDADGGDVDIFGFNGTGKTTVANALSWLLTGKPSTDEKSYNPKTKNKEGDDIHGLNHIAEAEFMLDDGSILTLKKDYHEESVGKKTRSSQNNVQKTSAGPESNMTDYYIDGKKVLQRNYDQILAALFTPEQAQMLTLPHFFSEGIEWQDRRRILTDIAGDISDEDVMKAYPELLILKKKLNDPLTGVRKSVEKYRIELLEEVKSNTKILQTIQPRIDEAEKAKPNLEGKDLKASKEAVARLKKEKDALVIRKDSLTVDDALIKNREALAKLEAEFAERKSAYMRLNDDENTDIRKVIEKDNERLNALSSHMSGLNSEILNLQRNRKDIEQRIEDKRKDIENTKTAREKAAEKLKELNSKSYEPLHEDENSKICPHCGQMLPEHMLKAMHESFMKAEAARKEEFEKKLEREKAEVIAKGESCSKTVIETLEKDLEDMRNKLDSLNKGIDSKTKELNATRKEYADAEKTLADDRGKLKTAIPYEETSEGRSLLEKKGIYAKAVHEGEDSMTAATEALDSEIKALDKAVSEEEAVIYSFLTAEQQEKRILELHNEEKRIRDLLLEMDETLKLLDHFAVLKAELFSENINRFFHSVKFMMYKVLINTTIKEMCEPMVKNGDGWIPWSSASSAEKINGGLEIINVLSNHYGIHLPIVIDNAESVCRLTATDSQQIRLHVSEKDLKLRIQTTGQENEARVGA